MEHRQCLVFLPPRTHDIDAATGGVKYETQGQHQCSKRGACTTPFCVLVTTHSQMSAVTGGVEPEAQGQGQRSKHGARAALWRVLCQDPRSHRQALLLSAFWCISCAGSCRNLVRTVAT